MIAPSGEQFEFGFEDQRAVVVEVGGGLRSYGVGDRRVLDGYAVQDMCSSGRGQVLIPWPNRLQDGSYEFGGRRHQLPVNETARGNAIHGLVRWASWTAASHEPSRVVLKHVLHPQPGYPFTLALSIDYQLSKAGLSVTTTATNDGPESCPYGCGAHPYLNPGAPTIDTATLEIPARTVLTTDDRGIPVGTRPVDDTAYDFRTPRPIGATKLDHAFTDLERGDDGLARVRLTSPGSAVTLWVDESYPI
jgi:aldose 1-epimerase